MRNAYTYNEIGHEPTLTSSSSSITQNTHPSSASTVSDLNSSEVLKEPRISLSPLHKPTKPLMVDYAQNIDTPSYCILDGGHPTTESPISKACLSSMITEYKVEKCDHRKEMFTECLMRPDPPEHKSPKTNNVTDKSFMGVVSAINAMNASMNSSRLSNINLASALETYAAVIHSRTTSSFSIDADMNEARANCFDHAAVFWMEWANVQANLQLSLMQDLFRLKNLADTSIDCEHGPNTEALDADSIRTMVVKLTKLSHDSFKEAYKKGSDWSSVGGLNYWASQLPRDVAQGASIIIPASDYPSAPPHSVANIDNLTTAAEFVTAEQVSLKESCNEEGLRPSDKLSDANLNHQLKNGPEKNANITDTPSSHQYLPDSPSSKGLFGSTDTSGVYDALRRNNERTVHSFRYPNGQKGVNRHDYVDVDFVSVVPQSTLHKGIDNRRKHLTRSHQTLDFSKDCYLDTKKDHKNKLGDQRTSTNSNLTLRVEDTIVIKGLVGESGYPYDQDTASFHDLIKNQSITNGTSFNEYITGSYESAGYEDSDSSSNYSGQLIFEASKDVGWDDQEYAEEITPIRINDPSQEIVDWESLDETPSGSYLTRPLPYAITEEDSSDKTPPLKKRLCQLGVAFSYTTPPKSSEHSVEAPRPGGIRRKGKFEKKNGAIKMLFPKKVETSSSEDEDVRLSFNPMSGGNDESGGFRYNAENVKKPPITTISGAQHDIDKKLKHVEIPSFDEGNPLNISNNQLDYVFTFHANTHSRCHSAKPLEPNLNPPDQYPSRGYFSEDLQRVPMEATLEKVVSLTQDEQRSHSRWSNHLKRVMNYIPGRDESNSPTPMSSKSRRPTDSGSNIPPGTDSSITGRWANR